jgi:hypothetical protein
MVKRLFERPFGDARSSSMSTDIFTAPYSVSAVASAREWELWSGARFVCRRIPRDSRQRSAGRARPKDRWRSSRSQPAATPRKTVCAAIAGNVCSTAARKSRSHPRQSSARPSKDPRTARSSARSSALPWRCGLRTQTTCAHARAFSMRFYGTAHAAGRLPDQGLRRHQAPRCAPSQLSGRP